MTITQHRWSIGAAWQNAAAQQQRDKDGQVIPFTPPRIAVAAIMTPYYVLNPATVIHRHSAGVTARVVNKTAAILVTLVSLLGASAALVAMFTTTAHFAAFVVTLATFVVIFGGFGDHYAAWKAPSGTHLLIDLVRDPDGASGYSSTLVRSIARFPPDVVTGTCPDPKVWSAAYEGNADVVEQTPNGKTRFVLHPKI